MRTSGFLNGAFILALTVTAFESAQTESPVRAVREALWVWGNPEMAEDGEHGFAAFAQAGPAGRARLLGVPNIVMAGLGLPRDDETAFELTAEVAHAPRLVWEIGGDTHEGSEFEYGESVARVARLVEKYAQIEAVMLDDMSSVKIDRGFKPAHVQRLKAQLVEACPQVKLWGVVYTMNLDIPNIDAYIRELDVINLWVWHAKDLPALEDHIAQLEDRFPDKPIVLGLYLYDYGEGRRMPLDLHARQCATALRLLQAGRIRDIVFLTITNDAEAVRQTAEWTRENGEQPIRARHQDTP